MASESPAASNFESSFKSPHESAASLSWRSRYRYLSPFLKKQRLTILQALACTLGFTAFWPALAWLPGQLADPIGTGDLGAIAQLAGVGAIIFVVRGVFQFGQDSLMAKAALAIARDLRVSVYDHLQKLSLDYFEAAKSGDIAYRLTGDVDRVGDAINKLFHQFVPCVLQLIVVLTYMIVLNWQLTLASLIIAPLMAILIGWFGERLLDFARSSQGRVSNLAAMVTEVIAGMRLVRAFTAESYEMRRFTEEADASRLAKYRAERAKAMQFVVVGFLQAMSVLLLFWLGGWQISQGQLTGAGFISYIAAVALLIDPISITTSNYNEFKESQASVDRLFALLLEPILVSDRPNATPLPPITGTVTYDQVTFAYPNGSAPNPSVLENLSFTAKPGEAIALVGASGAGKTTLINLLTRFYDPQHGRILVDNTDIKTITAKSLRQQIGLVPQDTVLFSGTIAQNIAFGCDTIDFDAVEKAARVANAHDFIRQFSQGYHTWVGERGVNLSGGQRQRIAIARAVLLNPKILILDEATSALDSESEALVQEALQRLTVGRTVFAIAHRLSTVREASRILVMENGKIIESGTHDQLLNAQGRYAAYYAQQFRS